MSDVVVEPSQLWHASAVIQDWAPYHYLSVATEPTYDYRLFPWELIIPHTAYTCFAAVVGNSCEGLLAILRAPDRLKVAFLATAPWNYKGGRRGIGTGLLSYAVTIADEEGFPQVVLDATPEAEPYYDRIGWTKTGNLGEEELTEFCLTSDRFDSFATKHLPLTRKESP